LDKVVELHFEGIVLQKYVNGLKDERVKNWWAIIGVLAGRLTFETKSLYDLRAYNLSLTNIFC
jgi:hypothetical protein